MIFTIRNSIHTKYLCKTLIEHGDILDVNIKSPNQTWWHVKKYPFDYKAIYDAENDVEEFKCQMREKLEEIKEFAKKLKEVLGQNK